LERDTTGHKEEIFYDEGGEALARLPREAVNAAFLGTFQARLDGALGNLIEWKVSLLTAGGLD